MMNHGALLLFAVPTLCILVVAFAQFGDEMFKKKFVIERRKAQDENSRFRRRYSDQIEPEAQSETDSSPESEASASSTDSSFLETSGNRR